MICCIVDGLGIDSELGILESVVTGKLTVLDSELGRDGGYWNQNCLRVRFDELRYSPDSLIYWKYVSNGLGIGLEYEDLILQYTPSGLLNTRSVGIA